MADFSLNACYESVVFEVETLKVNVFEALGRAIIRAEQDVFYNKTMIEAYKKYISDHNIKWNEQFNSNRAGAVTQAESEGYMKIWYIWGIGLERLEIKADSFDKAIEEARKINKNYCAGQLKE